MLRSSLKIRDVVDTSLVWHHPLSEQLSVLPTGQSVTQSGSWTFGTVSGIPCATKANGNASIKDVVGTGVPVGSSPRSMSIWLLKKNNNAIDVAGYGTTTVSGGWRFNITSGGNVNFPPFGGYAASMTANVWYHYACVFDGTNVANYVNAELKNTATKTLDTTAISSSLPVFIGWSAWQYGFSVADVRIYNRVLDVSEISALFAMFTPTT